MPLNKLRPGAKVPSFPGGTWNTMIDLLRTVQRERTRFGSTSAIDPPRSAGALYIKNDSETDCPGGGVLGIDSPLYTPTDSLDGFRHKTALSGSTPASYLHKGKCAITLGPIAAGAVGLCVVTGYAPVMVNVVDEDHDYADITEADNSKLTSAYAGSAQIVWKESGTGDKWAIVRLPIRPAAVFAVTLTSDIAAGASGSVTLPDGRVVTAENWSADTDLATGDKCLCFLDEADGAFYLIKSGGGGGDPPALVYYAHLSADLAASDSNGSATNLTLYADGGVVIAGPVSLVNVFNLSGRSGDPCVVAYNEGDPRYDLWVVASSGRQETIEATVYNPFSKDSSNFLAVVIRSYTGYKAPGATIVVENQESPFQNGGKPYLFEGEFGAVCRVQYDAQSGKYRVDWVECPRQSPVSPGSGSEGMNAADLAAWTFTGAPETPAASFDF